MSTGAAVPSFALASGVVGPQRQATYMGSWFYNAHATADALVTISDTSSGRVLQKRHLVAGESTDDWFGDRGIMAKGGCTASITGTGAGSVSGELRIL